MGNGMVTQSEESITLNDVLPAFLTTTADPSHPLRMTINIPLIMTPFLPIVILNGARMLFGKDGKRKVVIMTKNVRRHPERQRRIYYRNAGKR